jgi:hypothetical protein
VGGRRANDGAPGRVRSALPLVLGVVAAGALVGVAAASGPLYVSSTGSALLARELDPVGGEGAVVLDLRTSGAPSTEEFDQAEATLRAELRARDLPDPELQLLLDDVSYAGAGDTEPAPIEGLSVLGLPGADQELPPSVEEVPVDDGRPTVAVTGYSLGAMGAALPDGAVEVGDELELSAGDGSITVVIDRVVEDFTWGAIPPFWQPVSFYLAPNPDPSPNPPPPPTLLVDTEVARELFDALDLGMRLQEVGEGEDEGLTFWTGQGRADVTWRVRLDGLPTLDEMQRIAPAVEELRGMAVSGQPPLGSELRPLSRLFDSTSPPLVGGQVGPVVDRVEAAVAGLRAPVTALAVLGQVLALAVLAATVVTTGRARLARARLWSVRGVAPTQLGLRWAAAVVPPLLVGIAAGWWVAPLLVARVGEGAVDPAAHLGVWPQLLLAAAVATLLVAVTVVVVARRGAATDRVARSAPPVAEVLAVLLLGVALWQVRDAETLVAVDAEGRVSLDLLAVALPLVLVVAVAVLGARLLRFGASRLATTTPGARGWWFLATRRLRSLGGAAAALAVVSATAVGVLVAAGTLASSSAATVEEKSRVAVGAEAAVPLPRSAEGRDRQDLGALQTATTEVLRIPEVLLGERAEVDVLAIDPATFAEVATQPRGLDRPVAEVIEQLTSTPDGAATAILVQPSGGGSGPATLRVESTDLPVEVVDRVPTFPGATGERPTVVVARDDLFDPDDTSTLVRLAFSTAPELWLATDVRDEVSPAALETTGLELERFVSARELIEDPGTAPLTWTFVFLRAQAAVLAAVAVLALVAHHVARRRSQALATALAGRMGLGRTARLAADAAELALLLVATVGLGVVAGLAAGRLVLPQYDPLPGNALPSVFVAPESVVLALLGTTVGLLVLAVVATARAAERTEVATLLRGAP